MSNRREALPAEDFISEGFNPNQESIALGERRLHPVQLNEGISFTIPDVNQMSVPDLMRLLNVINTRVASENLWLGSVGTSSEDTRP